MFSTHHPANLVRKYTTRVTDIFLLVLCLILWFVFNGQILNKFFSTQDQVIPCMTCQFSQKIDQPFTVAENKLEQD